MTYTSIDNINGSDFSGIFVYANEVTGGLLGTMILVVFFFIVALASYNASRRLTGEGDFVASFATAAYLTTGLSFLMLLVDGLMTLPVASVALVVSIIATTWLYFDKRV